MKTDLKWSEIRKEWQIVSLVNENVICSVFAGSEKFNFRPQAVMVWEAIEQHLK